ncbi:MAG: hypothetical protein EPO07_20455 [Verrucomicrobia bacterium]|nr:MAG: hypothetical protein EPO07_20455 [Verrucomicrobiota bacterium]
MKSSALVFLAAFLALAASWGGFVLAPQIQLGRTEQVKPTGGDGLYPAARPGQAAQGAQVYRSLGCVYCHSQQAQQDGIRVEVVLTEAGTNTAATLKALNSLNPELAKNGAAIFASLPQMVLQVHDATAADAPLKALQAGGGKAEVHLIPTGTDISRGWGKRRTVAQDFIYDSPVQLGSRRVGPDLANVGARLTTEKLFRHLYAPSVEVNGSFMPAYRFLFETHKVGSSPTSDALTLPKELAPAEGCEFVPTEDARALVAYLQSLRADAPLYEAPVTIATAKPAAATTNSPAK